MESGSKGQREMNRGQGQDILLIVDDEPDMLPLLKRTVSAEVDWEILTALSAREALEIMGQRPVSLLLLDIKMPEINGLEATRQIKLINKDIPVIAITAYAMSGDEQRVLAAGCDGYLSKPLTKNSLWEKITEFIKL